MIRAIPIFRHPNPCTEDSLGWLQQQLLLFSFFNLFLVTASGLFMRAFPLLPSFSLQYKNMLHAHSHFAFGGWVMPILTWMIMQYFPSINREIKYHHWRNIIVLILVSAYGMLASFPFEGYALISIIFSSLSVAAGFYLAIVIWRAPSAKGNIASLRFLKAGLFYLVLSSIGPFATGPLIAMGKAGSPIYFNAIYFYLHFQYNGWFSFALLAVIYALIEKEGRGGQGDKTFKYFNLACLPAYFMSVLWNHPHPVFYFIAGFAGLLQIIGLYFLIRDCTIILRSHSLSGILMKLALIAFSVKIVLQCLSALPFIATMAYQTRNFIIAYLHLVLLGFITLSAFSMVLGKQPELINKQFRTAVILFLISFFITELMLALEAFGSLTGYYIPHFTGAIFVASCFFPAGALLIYIRTGNYYRKKRALVQLAA